MISRIQSVRLSGGKKNTPLAQITYETEAVAFFSGYDLTAGEKYAYNRWFKRMKAKGLLAKIQAAWMLAYIDGRMQALSLVGDYALTGSATSTIYQGARFSAGQFFDTGFSASLINAENCHLALMSDSAETGTAPAFGCEEAGGVGFTIIPYGAQAKLGSSTLTAAQANADGRGFILASRNNSATVRIERNGREWASAEAASAGSPLPSENLYIGCANLAGTPGTPTDKLLTFASVGLSMTHEESQWFYAITRTLWHSIRYGCPDFRDAGRFPQSVTADLVVYGATPGGIVAAYEAARQGLSVAIVGGWRDRHLGGMWSGGLGHFDWNLYAKLSGLSDWALDQGIAVNGTVMASGGQLRNMEPHAAEAIFKQMLDPRRKHGLPITVYWSDGVDTVTKDGLNITSLTTVDGRTFNGTTFHDGSYEGDLIARAGVRYRIGREAGGTGGEVRNGYRPDDTLGVVVDPYVTPGSSSSGLIFGVNEDDGRAAGTADAAEYVNRVEVSNSGVPVTTQPYNFRQAMSQDERRRIPFDSSPPDGYDPAKFELHIRYWAARQASFGPVLFVGSGSDVALAKQGLLSTTSATNVARYGAVYDVNSTSKMSSDWVGQNWGYPEADYTARAQMWTDHIGHHLGLIYTAAYLDDARIPASMRTDALTWGWADTEHLDPYDSTYGSDPLFFPKQLYVRAGRRIVGEVTMDANHLKETSPIISTKTVANTSYYLDSHVIQAVARDVSGTVRVVLDGGFFDQTSGGSDFATPIPLEVMVPKAAECSNLTSSFVVSATHVANGQIRMEGSSMQMGQAAGVIAAIRSETGQAILDIDYEGVLRPRLLASRQWFDETQMILDQTVG